MAETITPFYPTGALQTYVVPDGVYVVRAVVNGGRGTPGTGDNVGRVGSGANIDVILPVTPRESLTIAVGANGNASASGPTPNGSGLGRGGPGAGAASHIARGATRLVVAGGGGASGGNGWGGDGIGSPGRMLGLVGRGGGEDPTWASSDGEGSTDGAGSGGGGWIGGRAGRTHPITNPAGPGGGGGSSKAPPGAAINSGLTNTGGVSIISGVAPLPPTITSPLAGDAVDRTSALTVAFTFHGAGSGDTLSACEVLTSEGQTFPGGTDPAITIPASALILGAVALQVRTANQHGTWSSYSQPITIRMGTAPSAPVITSPAGGATIETADTVLTWTSPTQVAWRARRISDVGGAPGPTVLFDTGPQPGAAHTTTLALTVDRTREHLQVLIADDTGIWSAAADLPITVRRARPVTPTVTAIAGRAWIDVTITNPTEAGRPPAVANHVLVAEPSGDLVRVSPTPIALNSTWRWELPRSGVDYLIAVQAVTAAGAAATGAVVDMTRGGLGLTPLGSGPLGL